MMSEIRAFSALIERIEFLEERYDALADGLGAIRDICDAREDYLASLGGLVIHPLVEVSLIRAVLDGVL